MANALQMGNDNVQSADEPFDLDCFPSITADSTLVFKVLNYSDCFGKNERKL